MFRTLYAFFIISLLWALPALAQSSDGERTAPDLADEATLRTFLPDRIGDYTFDQVSVPPFAAGKSDQESITLNAVYENEAGTALFLMVSQYRDPMRAAELRATQEQSVASGKAADTTLAGRRAFVEEDPMRIAMFVGSAVELAAYFAGGEGPADVLYAGLDAVDLDGLDALDHASVGAKDLTAVEAFDQEYLASDAASEPEKLVALTTIHPLLPEKVGEYGLTRLSASAVDDGWGSTTGRTLTARYEADGGRAFAVDVAHFRSAKGRRTAMTVRMPAIDTTIAGYSAYEESNPLQVKMKIGETFKAAARPLSGDVAAADLYAALEQTDVKRLEALDASYAESMREAMSPDVDPTEAITGVEGEVDCTSFNEEYMDELQQSMGVADLVPWAHVLDEERASTAERTDEEPVRMLDTETILTFPKAENAWLSCVRENDILWAPLGTASFLVRVKELWELPDRAAFRVVPATLTDLVQQGRIEQEAGSPD